MSDQPPTIGFLERVRRTRRRVGDISITPVVAPRREPRDRFRLGRRVKRYWNVTNAITRRRAPR